MGKDVKQKPFHQVTGWWSSLLPFVLLSVCSLQVQGEKLVFGQVLSRCCIDPLWPFPVSCLWLTDVVFLLPELARNIPLKYSTWNKPSECPSRKILPLFYLLSVHIQHQGLRGFQLCEMKTSKISQCKAHYRIKRNGRETKTTLK